MPDHTTPDPTPTLRDQIFEVIDAADGWHENADADTITNALMPVIAAELDTRWEDGRKHGLRQARRPHDARARQLESEIEDMLTLQEVNSRAWELKCARVRELEERLAELEVGQERRAAYADLRVVWARRAGREEMATEIASHFATAHEVATTGRDLIEPPAHMQDRSNHWLRYLRWAESHVREYADRRVQLARKATTEEGEEP